jgi:hypothetical protein
MMTTEINEARDWQGQIIECQGCAHESLRARGGCELMRACVADRYARRIDRFFRWNPEIARDYIDHPYFEVRAIAAKHVDVFASVRMLDDVDATVRWSAAARLPRRYLLRLRADPDREVRIRVALRIDPNDLVSMIGDPDYYVRQVVARRIKPQLLTLMVNDAEPEVRRTVATRIEDQWLPTMAADTDERVRLEVVERLPAPQLKYLRHDTAWSVRYAVAGRISELYLAEMLTDEDPMVRELARHRLDASGARPGGTAIPIGQEHGHEDQS